jgi:hypothetical protein
MKVIVLRDAKLNHENTTLICLTSISILSLAQSPVKKGVQCKKIGGIKLARFI